MLVNDAVVARGDHALAPGDRVDVRAPGASDGGAVRQPGAGIAILFADDDLVAIDKPAGLLSVSTDDQTERTALALVRAALSRPGRPARLWPAHRLDRETSGVLLLARSHEACDAVQADWGVARKVYLAVAGGRPEPPAGAIDLPLREDRNLRVHAGDHADARPARTRYRTIDVRGGRSLLEVELDTGRRHQIRVHLAAIGCPVVGDDRYGGEVAARLGRHARSLSLRHPRDRHALAFDAPVRRGFAELLDGA